MTRLIKPNLTLQVPWCLQLFVRLDGLGKLQRLCRKRALGLEVTQGKNHLWSPIKYTSKNSPATTNDAIKCYTGLAENGSHQAERWAKSSERYSRQLILKLGNRCRWVVSLTCRPLYFPPPGKEIPCTHRSGLLPCSYQPQFRMDPIHTLQHCSYYQPHEPNPHTATLFPYYQPHTVTLFLPAATWTRSTPFHNQSTPRHTVPLICFYVKSNVWTSLQKAHLPQPFHRTLSTSLLSEETTTKPNTHFAIHCSFSLAATPSIRSITRKPCTDQFNCKIKT